MDMDWELANVKKETPQSPTVKDGHETLTAGSDTMEKEESGTPKLYSTGLRLRLLTIVHSCLKSNINQSLGACENVAVGAETSPKEESVREVVLATEMHLQGFRRVLQSLVHSGEYKLLQPGDQKLAREEVRKLFGSKCVHLGFQYAQDKLERGIETQRPNKEGDWKGPQLIWSSTPGLKMLIRSQSESTTNPDKTSQTIDNAGARPIQHSASMNSTVIHFVVDISLTLASLQKTLCEVSTADLFFDASLAAWEITNLPDTKPNYLAVRIDNARVSQVIRFGDPEGYEEVLRGIMATPCWAEPVGGNCVVEVRGF